MKKVIRVIIYEGDDDWVDATLSKSLKLGYSGVAHKRGSIIILDASSDNPDLIAEENVLRIKEKVFEAIDNPNETTVS